GEEDHRRLGLRGPEDRRPPPQRGGALPQPGAQPCAPGRVLRADGCLLERDPPGCARSQSRGGGRTVPLRHRVRLPQPARHRPVPLLRSALVLADPAQGQDLQGAGRRSQQLCGRPCRAERQRRRLGHQRRHRRGDLDQVHLAARHRGSQAAAAARWPAAAGPARGGVAQVGRSVSRTHAAQGRIPRTPVRHRIRSSRSACHPQGPFGLLQLLRRPMVGSAGTAWPAARPPPRARSLQRHRPGRRGRQQREHRCRLQALRVPAGDAGGPGMSATAIGGGIAGRAWLAYALVMVTLWGAWGALSSISAERGFPDTLVYCVWALTMIPPALFVLWRSGWKLDRSPRAAFYGLLIGLLGAGGQMVLFHALTVGPAYFIFPIISLSPVVTIALSFVLLRERTGRIGAAGI